MFKEIEDIKNACGNIIDKAGRIKNTAGEINKLIDKIKSETSQENSVEITLAMRKELANMFILNSDIEDNFKNLNTILNSIKKIQADKKT